MRKRIMHLAHDNKKRPQIHGMRMREQIKRFAYTLAFLYYYLLLNQNEMTVFYIFTPQYY